MANPQKENGYVPIANDLLEALIRYRFTLREFKIVMLIIRQSYGWNRKHTRMSQHEIATATTLRRDSVGTAIRSLVASRVVKFNRSGTGSKAKRTYSLNKDFDQWKDRSK